MRTRAVVSVRVLCVLLLSGTALSQTRRITTIDLDTLGNAYSEAQAINNRGQVVGRSGGHAFFWSLRRGMVDLGAVSGTESSAKRINELGQVIGISRDRGFFWSEETGMLDLGTLGGPVTEPSDINNLGQVVGGSAFNPGSYVTRAFLWTLAGGLEDLKTLPGGTTSGAFEINDAGQVLGASEMGNGKVIPIIWTRSGGMRMFLPPTRTPPTAAAMNNHGAVTGWVAYRPFFWSLSQGLIDIGTLGGAHAWASEINDAGQVAGISQIAGSDHPHVFVWTPGEGMVDLGDLGGRSIGVWGMNANGEVVGFGTLATGPSGRLQENAYIASKRLGMLPLPVIAGRQCGAVAVNDRGLAVGFSTYSDLVDHHATLWIVRTPAEQLDALVRDVRGVVAGGGLSSALGDTLIGMLDASRGFLDRGREVAAVEKVRAFQKHVTLFAVKKVLTPARAELLNEQADWILVNLLGTL
jgi:probable HAF family extracellular repeat protein